MITLHVVLTTASIYFFLEQCKSWASWYRNCGKILDGIRLLSHARCRWHRYQICQFCFRSINDLKINSANDFNEVFKKRYWNSSFVLFIDEFNKMYEANEDVRSSCLETFRAMKNSKYNHAISAVPCVMLMDLAYSLDKYLDKGKQHNNTLQIITFDGEEAFKCWSSTWSIVTVGTFNILHLKSEKTSTSPFNVFEPFAHSRTQFHV